MAKILIVMPPLTGHINPALSVAAELRRRGHAISWAVHRDLITGLLPDDADIHALPADSLFDLGKRATGVRGLESVKFFYEEVCLPLARASLRPLQEIVQRMQPDLMICDHQMLAGGMVARALSIPWFTFVSTNASILKTSAIIDAWLAEQLAVLQLDYDLPVLARPDFSPHGVIVFSSPALPGDRHEFHEAQYHFVGPAFAHRQPAIDFPWQELRADSVRLLISLGTVNRDRGVRFYQVMMEALADLELVDTYLPNRLLQVVMVAPEEFCIDAPSNFIVRQSVPQIELLDHVDAVLCHAGHNTVNEALAFGLPLIVAPIRDDQPIVARQVTDAGAGLFMRYGKVTAATARATVQKLFRTPSYRINSLRLKESFRQLGGASQAANILDRFLQTTQSPPSGHRVVQHGVHHAMD